jgi:hypothetical protein
VRGTRRRRIGSEIGPDEENPSGRIGVADAVASFHEAGMRGPNRFPTVCVLAAAVGLLWLPVPTLVEAEEPAAAGSVDCPPGWSCPTEEPRRQEQEAPQEAQVGAGTTFETTTGTSGPDDEDDEDDVEDGAGEEEAGE